jgi:hypothetical protein
MEYKDYDYCICGHPFNMHDDGEEDGTNWCYECAFFPDPDEVVLECQQFKLDNLKYIEEKAKERKLI